MKSFYFEIIIYQLRVVEIGHLTNSDIYLYISQGKDGHNTMNLINIPASYHAVHLFTICLLCFFSFFKSNLQIHVATIGLYQVSQMLSKCPIAVLSLLPQ